MLAITRRNKIREQLMEHKTIQIADMADLLQVTRETIRRDLRYMEESGELIRTHGGAYILDGVHNDLDISTRQYLKTAEKELIAEKCQEIIQTGDYIFLDASTTAWFIAKASMKRKITVLTTSLEIINLLSSSDTVKLFAIGGEYSAATRSFYGNGANRYMSQYYVDKCFISCRNVSMVSGLTDLNDDDAELHRLALEHSNRRYLAVDNSKLDRSSFSHIAPVETLDGIILDCPFPSRWAKFLNENNIKMF